MGTPLAYGIERTMTDSPLIVERRLKDAGNGEPARTRAYWPAQHDRESCPRILLAEDSAVYRNLIKHELAGHFDVTLVSDGQEAWEAIQQPDSPSLIVLDWMLPGMDGVDVCRNIRTHLSDRYCYVILLTARTSEEDLLLGMEAGADDFVRKPFSAPELRARLRSGARILHLNQQLLSAATIDSLTQVRTRAALLAGIESELERCRRDKRPLGLIIADLDYFKTINDTAGHLAGDKVLREVAQAISQSIRSYDVVGRYGGEEFVIALPGADAEAVMRRSEEICRKIAKTSVHTEYGDIAVTVSLGATVSTPERTQTCEELLRRADQALYRAKSAGRNCIDFER